MKKTCLMMVLVSFMLLGACQSAKNYPVHKNNKKYVETENIQWDLATEEDQELADEI